MKIVLAAMVLTGGLLAGAAHAQSVSSCYVLNGETICRSSPPQPPYQPFIPDIWGLTNPGAEATMPGLTNAYDPSRPESVNKQVAHLISAGRCEEAKRMAASHFDTDLAQKVAVQCKL